jgi:hypothetical protein
MRKQKILMLVPLAIVLGFLIHCWTNALLNTFIPNWRHYIGIVLFVPLLILFFKDLCKAIIGLGVYLLLTTFNLVAITPAITTSWINFGSSGLTTPPVQLLSLGLFILYFIMNLDSLINIQLDYKKAKTLKIQKQKTE